VRPAILYIRVSTLDQAREGVSLATQRTRLDAWSVANGYEVAGVFSDDGISGKRADNRPALQQALDAVCKCRGALVVYSLSRLARSTRDAIEIGERLEKCGADLVSLSESIDTRSATGRAFFKILAVLAELERDLVAERTTAALAHKKVRGERIGEVPFGYASNDGKLEPITEELRLRKEMREMRIDGLSWSEIAENLNLLGILTKKGRDWSAQNARKIALGG
jgi:DNA invertase Pin-like site-specific DNA recombinase